MNSDFDPARLFSLAGKVAIVTGASRGLGWSMSEGLADAGAMVVGVARSAHPISAFRNPVLYLSGDVVMSAGALVERITMEFGGVDILVNAAGITLPGREPGEGLAAFERTLEVNLSALYQWCAAVRPVMRDGGSIINVTSIGGIMGFPGNPGYAASKGGVKALTRALAVDYGPAGIRVNSLAPGYIQTRMTEASYGDPVERERRRRHTCLGRWGAAEDVVGATIFLASSAASYVTGHEIVVDGGWTAKGLL